MPSYVCMHGITWRHTPANYAQCTPLLGVRAAAPLPHGHAQRRRMWLAAAPTAAAGCGASVATNIIHNCIQCHAAAPPPRGCHEGERGQTVTRTHAANRYEKGTGMLCWRPGLEPALAEGLGESRRSTLTAMAAWRMMRNSTHQAQHSLGCRAAGAAPVSVSRPKPPHTHARRTRTRASYNSESQSCLTLPHSLLPRARLSPAP